MIDLDKKLGQWRMKNNNDYHEDFDNDDDDDESTTWSLVEVRKSDLHPTSTAGVLGHKSW